MSITLHINQGIKEYFSLIVPWWFPSVFLSILEPFNSFLGKCIAL